jgi:hypothetical protein
VSTSWLIAGLVTLGVLALLGAWVGRILWNRQVRKSLVGLYSEREEVGAAYKAFRELLDHLVEGDESVWSPFCSDPTSEDRRALAELGRRMEIVRDELKRTPLPKGFWHVAELLETAASTLAEEVAEVGEGATPDEVLRAIAGLDLRAVSDAYRQAEVELDELLEAHGIEDPAVYGGGLWV